jgi:hypothetical protein
MDLKNIPAGAFPNQLPPHYTREREREGSTTTAISHLQLFLSLLLTFLSL